MMDVEVSEEALVTRLRIENSEYQKWEQEHRKLEDYSDFVRDPPVSHS